MLISCKSNGMDIAPIMPSEKFQFESDNSETLYFNNIEENRTLESDQSAGFSPIMQKETFDKLTSKVESILGDEKLPDGQLTILFSEPGDLALKNPPVLQFSLIAPESSILKDDIEVSLDGQDLSGILSISKINVSWRKADLFHAVLKPDFILDPRIEHEFNVRITPEDNNSLVHTGQFKVPMPQLPNIVSAGFRWDDTMTEPSMNELQVFLDVPDGINLESRIMNPLAWNITYENETALPPVTSIQKHPSGIKNLFIIELNSEATQNQKVRMIFSPFSGLNTRMFEFFSPVKPPDRGGESVERTASFDCSECTGRYSTTDPPDGDVHSAINCDNYHTFKIKAFCPEDEDCDGVNVHVLDRITQYYFNPAKYYQYGTLEDNGTAIPGVENSLNTESRCTNIERYFLSCQIDFRAKYRMKAYNGMTVCDNLATVDETVFSDRIVPSINSVVFPDVDNSDPNCSETCCKQVKYHLIVDASDDHCMKPERTMLIIFYSDGSYRDLPLQIVNGQTLDGDKRIIQEFVIDTANIFACVVGLKVIVHDKKGNWKAVMVQPQESGETERDEERLPYPSSISLNFGHRTTPDPENPNDQRQYVNLDRHFSEELDQTVCTRTIDDADHGQMLYIEVRVLPPVYGVNVLVEYEDPEFRSGANWDPTNTVDDPFNIVTSKFTPSYNGSLTLKEYKLLWGKHPPYPIPPWEEDGRTLGDNYNFFYTDVSQLNNPAIPLWDPIKAFHHIPSVPCFENPNCTGLPDVQGCFDYYCDEGETTLHTNLLGKAGVYLNTMGHGGDNFKIKASTTHYYEEDDTCLSFTSDKIFTVWRKIAVDFGYMHQRLLPNVFCNPGYNDFNGEFRIIMNNVNWVKGAYDDAFIEIVNGRDLGPNQYYVYVPDGDDYTSLHDYADNATPFHQPDYDVIELIGCDHGYEACAYGLHGETVEVPEPPHKHWHALVFVGNIYDCLKNKAPVSQADYRFYIDRKFRNNFSQCLGICATHEILHLFTNCFNGVHVETKYGVNCAGADQRSYLNHVHIIGMRHGIQGLFYDDQYQRCFNASGIAYFDTMDN
jgi:hypothetical protein